MRVRKAATQALLASLFAISLAAVSVTALADEEDDRDRGGRAPEAPLVILLPAAGAAVLGVRAAVSRFRRPPGR